MLPLRGHTFIGLNIVRIFSIIALILVFSSNISVIVNDVKAVNRFINEGRVASQSGPGPVNTTTPNGQYIGNSTVPNQQAGPFWAVLNRLLIICQVVGLLVSEFGVGAKLFDRYFPVLGDKFGLGALGIFQCLLGAAVLSHHVNNFALVSAFFLFAIGCINILAGLIFQEKAKEKRSVLTWQSPKSTKEVLPSYMTHTKVPPSFVSTNWTGSDYSGERKVGLGFGRQGEKAAGYQGYLVTRPVEALPRYAPKANSNPFMTEREKHTYKRDESS